MEKKQTWHQRNPEASRAYSRKYYRENIEKVKTWRCRWEEKNPDYAREYYLKNREKIRAQQAAYRSTDAAREKQRNYMREYNAKKKLTG